MSMRRTPEERLQHFVATVERCGRTRAVQQGTIASSFTIHSQRDEPVNVHSDLGDEDDVRSLMLEFRKFVSDKDDAHFESICNIVYRSVEDSEVRAWVNTNRATWTQVFVGDIEFDLDGVKFRGRSALDVWVNGVLFHNDPVKEAAYNKVEPHILRPMFHAEMNRMVIHGLLTVGAMRNVIEEVFARELLARPAPPSPSPKDGQPASSTPGT